MGAADRSWAQKDPLLEKIENASEGKGRGGGVEKEAERSSKWGPETEIEEGGREGEMMGDGVDVQDREQRYKGAPINQRSPENSRTKPKQRARKQKEKEEGDESNQHR